MNRMLVIAAGGVVLVGVCMASAAFAAKFNRQVDVGDPAPEFRNLIGSDDKPHQLEDYRNARVLVIVFTCNHCPVAKAYEDRFIEFAAAYKDKGVAFVAISVSNLEADRLPAMKSRAEQKKFGFSYLHDPSQQSARDYGATCTPHLFVLDSGRKIAYMGAFDDHESEKKVRKTYLRDAVDALLAGERPEVTETRQRGCSIEYDEKS